MINLKKIVSNVLIVSTQLIVGGLFLFMLFSGNTGDNRVVVVENNNLDKMADAVSVLFEVDHTVSADVDETKVEELVSAEEKAKQEEAARIAAEEEARRKAEEEAQRAREEAERVAREEAERKAREEEAARVAISSDQSVAALQEYARNLVINSYGWTNDDFIALVKLWNRESGWNVTAGNPSSGAYGIPQSLPGNKMASEGADWATNGETQIRWGLKYILNIYGSPSNAWNRFLERCSTGNCWY